MSKPIFKESTMNPEVIGQVGCALGQIAELATVIKRNSIKSIVEMNEGEDGQEALEALILSNQHLAAQVGFLADLCSRSVNSYVMNGGAEQWLLPPAYHCQSEPIHAA